MKADLYNAQARTAGDGGLAHRTAAGFVVLTSADGGDLIELITANQSETDLIDRIVDFAQNQGPEAFAMLFTAGGELYLIASGNAQATISSPSTKLSMSPAPGQVLVHPLSAGINERAANIVLRAGMPDSGSVPTIDLQAGTIPAEWIEVAVGGAAISTAAAVATAEPEAEAEEDHAAAAEEPASEAPESAAQEPTAPADADSEAEDALAEASEVAEEEAAAEAEEADGAAEESSSVAEAAPVAAAVAAAVPSEDIPDPLPAHAEPEAAIAPAAERTRHTVGEPVHVLGMTCQQGHHNHPEAAYCSQCGTRMGVQESTVLVNGPRPPLGVLVVDDGTTYSLSEDLVIGREPTSHEDVISGHASPMILSDESLSLSRKHARIMLDDWQVAVQDLGSSNGTYLSRSGRVESWTRVGAGSTTPLEPGDRLRVGGRVIQVELHHHIR